MIRFDKIFILRVRYKQNVFYPETFVLVYDI
jgi:hypothetical protein